MLDGIYHVGNPFIRTPGIFIFLLNVVFTVKGSQSKDVTVFCIYFTVTEKHKSSYYATFTTTVDLRLIKFH